MATQTQHIGRVVQIIGAVVDVEFEDHLPEIYSALRIVSEPGAPGEAIDVIAEVEQHLGENRVRTVAMKPTDGLQRGMAAEDLGGPISVPVGPETLGRVLNVLGFVFTFSITADGKNLAFTATVDARTGAGSAVVPAAFNGAPVRFQAGAYQQADPANGGAADQGARVTFHALGVGP